MPKKIFFNPKQYSLFDDNQDSEKSTLTGGADLRTEKTGKSELETPVVELEKNNLIKYISFGSGSSGNCSFIGNEEEGFLIDAGVESDTVFKGLKDNGIALSSIKGICLTHDHSDHIRYAYNILRKIKTINLFCTNRVMNGLLRRHNISRRIKDYHVAIFKEIPFKLAGFEITAFEVPHDGTCNSGYSISNGKAKFVLATDLGRIKERARFYMQDANYLVIESNYDMKMLENGSYPEYLKNRILAENGHLCNDECAQFLAEIVSPKLKSVFLCHLSNDNNTPELARRTSEQALIQRGVTVGEGSDSLVDRAKDVQLVVLPRYDITRCYKFRNSL